MFNVECLSTHYTALCAHARVGCANWPHARPLYPPRTRSMCVGIISFFVFSRPSITMKSSPKAFTGRLAFCEPRNQRLPARDVSKESLRVSSPKHRTGATSIYFSLVRCSTFNPHSNCCKHLPGPGYLFRSRSRSFPFLHPRSSRMSDRPTYPKRKG
jgi:hypothetical protein